MPIQPTLSVQVAFGVNALTTPGAGDWVDITSYVRSGSITMGRSSELEDFQAGTLNLALDNRARTFDPFYASGPYYANLKARRLIRVRATWAGTTYDLFQGHVSSWPLKPELGGDSVTSITAYDGLAYLAQVDLPPDLYTWTIQKDASYTNLVQWWPLGATSVVAAPRAGSQTLTFSTMTPQAGSSPTTWLNGPSQVFGGTYGALTAPVDAAGAFSVTFLFKSQIAGPSGGLNPILASADATPAQIGIDSSGRLAYYRGAGNTGHSGFAANNDAWHHAAVTWAGAGAINIYVDGVLLSTGNTTGTGGDETGWAYLGIGSTASDATNFTGELAHVCLYNAELSASTIAMLAQAALRGTPYGVTTSDKWIEAVLDAAGWPSAWRTLETGTIQPGGMKWGTNALSVLQQIARTERGRIFVNRLGNIEYTNGSHDYTATRTTTSQATYSDSGVAGTIGYSDLGEIRYSDAFLANQVTVTTATGGAFTANDSTSQTTYGIRARQIDTLLETQDDAQTYATVHLQNYKDPALRLDGWVVVAQSAPATAFPKVLDSRLTDRVTFELQPNRIGTRISQAVTVEGLAHSFDLTTWQTAFIGSPAVQAWLLEDATYGLLETTTILG